MVTVLDLFRGAGGWSVACRNLGFDEWGIEINSLANDCANFAGHRTASTDVWKPPVWLDTTRFDGLIGSPPCQTYSTSGKGTGRKALDEVIAAIKSEAWKNLDDLHHLGGDPRTALVLTPLHYQQRMQPDWMVLEQVPAVLPVWQEYGHILRKEGYSVWSGMIQSEQYGVPQTRTRAVLIASRSKKVWKPKPTHSRYHRFTPERLDPGMPKWVSLADALGWKQGYEGKWPGPGPDPRLPATTITCHQSFSPRCSHGPGMQANNPCPTSVMRKAFEAGETVFEFTPRPCKMTVEEMAVLQGFPPLYPWQGTDSQKRTQIGNAVPPPMAEAILREATQ